MRWLFPAGYALAVWHLGVPLRPIAWMHVLGVVVLFVLGWLCDSTPKEA